MQKTTIAAADLQLALPQAVKLHQTRTPESNSVRFLQSCGIVVESAAKDVSVGSREHCTVGTMSGAVH